MLLGPGGQKGRFQGNSNSTQSRRQGLSLPQLLVEFRPGVQWQPMPRAQEPRLIHRPHSPAQDPQKGSITVLCASEGHPSCLKYTTHRHCPACPCGSAVCKAGCGLESSRRCEVLQPAFVFPQCSPRRSGCLLFCAEVEMKMVCNRANALSRSNGSCHWLPGSSPAPHLA